jgi:SAM-dependent methyltransferase
MPEDRYVPVFNWEITELTVSERLKSIQPVWTLIAPLVAPGMRVLDLCCGSGAAAFLAEERGAAVAAVDSSPLLIEQGRAEAARRGSAVEFIQADVLGMRFEENAYDLALVLGNPFVDFEPGRFGAFRDNLAAALKPEGRAVLEFYDGVRSMQSWAEPAEQVREREPEEIASRFVGYDAAAGAFKLEAHNRTRDERSTYHGYVYTLPLLRQLLAPRFALEQPHELAEWKFLDVYTRA